MLFSHLFNQPAHPFCWALAAGFLPRGIRAWRGSQPRLGSGAPAVTGGAASGGWDAQSQEAAAHHGAQHSRAGTLSWGAPRVLPLHRDPQQVPWRGSSAGRPLWVSTSHRA